MNQHGGIKIKKSYGSAENAFDYFIDNLKTIKLITHETKGGILFKLDLNESVETPYFITRSNYPNKPVYSILIKVCYINDSVDAPAYTNPDLGIALHTCDTEDFYNEIIIQCNIFKGSLDKYLEPICPSIIHSKLYDVEQTDPLIKLLFQNSHSIKEMTFLKSMHKCFVNDGVFKLGLIAMEYMDGFIPLDDINPKNDLYDKLAIFELWRLYNLPQRYLHGDPHKYNFMVDPNYDYINGIKGRVIIIDFGATFEHEGGNIIKNNSISTIISLSLNNPSPIWDFNIREFPSYKWLCNIEMNEISELLEIYELRKIEKQLFSEHVITLTNGNIYNHSFSGGTKNYLNSKIFTSKFIAKYIEDEKINANEMIKYIKNEKVKKYIKDEQINVNKIIEYIKNEKEKKYRDKQINANKMIEYIDPLIGGYFKYKYLKYKNKYNKLKKTNL
jgi:hypothetical protein